MDLKKLKKQGFYISKGADLDCFWAKTIMSKHEKQVKSMPIGTVKITVKYKPIYECRRCKGREMGDTLTKEFQTFGAESAAQFFFTLPSPLSAIPLAWRYSGELICPNCKNT